uniref:Nucleic acid binding protein n=1 Tax=Shallot virus X TaxID=31770 RepID=A0A6M2VIK6_SHVX|nr:nucleic acid binding protein [Shallot virus X]
MHPHDFNLLCCLHFTKPSLPNDLKTLLFRACETSCKLNRRLLENKPFQGTSKCAKRRRAKRYNRCFDCGAYLYDNHVCKRFTSRSNSDCLSVIHQGPAKLYAEGAYRANSDAEQLIMNDILLIKSLKL